MVSADDINYVNILPQGFLVLLTSNVRLDGAVSMSQGTYILEECEFVSKGKE